MFIQFNHLFGGADSETEYGYDSEGNISSVTDPNGYTTYYGYDGLNRLIEVTQPVIAATTYHYDAHGNLESVTDAGGLSTIGTWV